MSRRFAGVGQLVGRLRDRGTLLGYRAGWGIVRRLPARPAYAAFDLIARLMHRRGGRRVARLRSNYAAVRPELAPEQVEALVEEGLRSYMRYWCDAFRLPDLTRTDLDAAVRGVGDGPVKALLDAGEPVLVFLGHLGNWDLGGAWSTTHLAPVHTVAERLRPEELFDEFVAFREGLGMTILPLTGGADVFRTLVRFTREGRLVALLADRDLTAGGVEVDLCGQRARMAVGPAALAVATGAALFTCTVTYEKASRRVPRAQRGTGSGYRTVVTFSDRVPMPTSGTTRDKVAAMTQTCADSLGAVILGHTQDWHMLQRVFVADARPGDAGGAGAGGPEVTAR